MKPPPTVPDEKTANVEPDRLARFTDDADTIASRTVTRAGSAPPPAPGARR